MILVPWLRPFTRPPDVIEQTLPETLTQVPPDGLPVSVVLVLWQIEKLPEIVGERLTGVPVEEVADAAVQPDAFV
jgi:hypothetical protein